MTTTDDKTTSSLIVNFLQDLESNLGQLTADHEARSHRIVHARDHAAAAQAALAKAFMAVRAALDQLEKAVKLQLDEQVSLMDSEMAALGDMTESEDQAAAPDKQADQPFQTIMGGRATKNGRD